MEVLKRAFKYNGRSLPDPDPAMSPDEVRAFYANTYPELQSGVVDGPDDEGSKLVFELRRAVGTKGTNP
jgi:PRTRC genetic system protein C